MPRPSPRDESKEKDVALQFSLVCAGTYADPAFFAETPAWPVPRAAYDPAVGRLSTEVCFDEAELAEELGFDMVSVSEHHYWPLIPTPNAALTAAALTQRTKRVRLGWLGPLVSMSNPVRIAEEAAQLDEMSGGRLSLLFLRGTPNEFLAYNVNPDETRARTQEATQLIVRALSEPQPFGWRGVTTGSRPFRCGPAQPSYLIRRSSPQVTARSRWRSQRGTVSPWHCRSILRTWSPSWCRPTTKRPQPPAGRRRRSRSFIAASCTAAGPMLLLRK